MDGDDIMILDTFDTIFVWVGAQANRTEKQNARHIANVTIALSPNSVHC
ncbi:unnamed protein product [Anisakis simplex]|uniref:Gelsolin-like domain-containing protein n=1 Tax=Anisakis simplex TaxID=6269 RepID=A0A3P6PRX8_ANISI|nr:unnamed protein product [Anisakis simplex]